MFLVKGVQAAGSSVAAAAGRGLDAVSACAVKVKNFVVEIFEKVVEDCRNTNARHQRSSSKQIMKNAVKEFNLINSEYRGDAEREIEKKGALECPGFFERGHGFDESRTAYNCKKAYDEARSEYTSAGGTKTKYDVSLLDAVRAVRK